jgi:hypothetical protein
MLVETPSLDTGLQNAKRRQADHTPSILDKILPHIISSACRSGVFQIALFKGFSNIPHIPPPLPYRILTGHKQDPEIRSAWHICRVPERY